MFFFKMLSPAYRKRRARVLRFRSVRPSRRRMFRLVNSLYAEQFTRFLAGNSPFGLSPTPIPANSNKTIQFFTYASKDDQ